MEDNRDTFTGRMLDRASCRRNLNGVVIDTTSEHLRRKYSILRAIDDDSGHKRGDNHTNLIQTRYNAETMKIGTEENNVSIITSLSAAIDDLDTQINSLGIQERKMQKNQNIIIPTCNQIYPNLIDIKFDTPHKNNNKENIANRNRNLVNVYETPKATRRYHKPNLESTRKSIKQELSEKMSPPQIETTISTIALIDSPPFHEKKSPDFIQPTVEIPDEVEKFLQNALGDELYNTTYTDLHQLSNSNINASDMLSESRTPFHRKLRKLLRRNDTTSKDNSILSPTKTPETVDRTARFYRSLSQRVKKKLRAALSKQKSRVDNNSPVPIFDFPHGPVDDARNTRIENLLRQVRIQQSIISQATKALEVCHSNKEFIGSSEEVESQRLLLLAYLRKRVMMEELKNLSSPDQRHVIKPEDPSTEYAEVQIDNIQLTLRKGLHYKPQPGETHEWFVVVIFEGTNVWSTSAVPCPIDSLTVEFPDFSCIVTKLTPKLKITVEVYILKLVTGNTYHHDEKYHISNMKIESHTCPSPTKLLKKVEHPLSPRARRHPILLTSSFISSGYVELFLGDLILVSPWPLSAVSTDSSLLGTIDFKLTSKLHLSITHQGFLNYGNESGGLAIWNRRWCVLKGHSLMFWNYPREQENKKTPLMTIDLINCTSEKIAPVNRSLCAKPRTLLIETARTRLPTDRDSLMVECRQSYTIIRHLLSCDSTRELVDWMSKLNHVVSVLREWNISTTYSNTIPLALAPPMVSEL